MIWSQQAYLGRGSLLKLSGTRGASWGLMIFGWNETTTLPSQVMRDDSDKQRGKEYLRHRLAGFNAWFHCRCCERNQMPRYGHVGSRNPLLEVSRSICTEKHPSIAKRVMVSVPRFPNCKMDTTVPTFTCPLCSTCDLSVGGDDPNLGSHSRGCL